MGKIPHSMGNLSSLRIFYADINNLEGNIPDEIRNQLNGSLPDDMFLTLPNLNTLAIGGNHMTVTTLTCCSSINYKGQEFKALVFDYMMNGSLEKWLHPGTESANQPTTLSLVQRVNIIADISGALHYLHYECEQPIIHCDLKPENVLDHDMVVHVGNFGLARLLSTINGTSQKQTSSTLFKGTVGYAPPEYDMGSDVSTRGDVYSFEILVLEMLTGRRPTEEIFIDGEILHSYVKTAYPDNRFSADCGSIYFP
ncbi:hypothetical protein L6164_013029 [Bauhinia variegata]|uniref:Uncharacterized protein n=1 Tax=Bauhinia variegata TaxID=167791 RepID=A0ACB9PAU7_BAUVA|nr:hypothetical protein L6164_013029 [Bauhinia variegata]